jgi:ferredoxin
VQFQHRPIERDPPSEILSVLPIVAAQHSGHSLRVTKEVKAMRIVVDLNKCLGYAQCVPLAPTVLKLSGEEALMYDPNPDDSLRQQVLRAAASCPVQAIIVDRLEGEKKGEKA